MDKQQRLKRQQILGIVNMVFDIFEKEDREPTATELFIAINHWHYFGKAPTLERITYGVSRCQIKYDVDNRD